MINELIQLYENRKVSRQDKIDETLRVASALLLEHRETIQSNPNSVSWHQILSNVEIGTAVMGVGIKTGEGFCLFLTAFHSALIWNLTKPAGEIPSVHDLRMELQKRVKHWPEYSGVETYPVPGTAPVRPDLSAELTYDESAYENLNMFGTTQYANNRWRMIEWLHQQMTEQP